MALALPPAGRIWTIDPDIERSEIAMSYFRRAGVEDRIEIINQPALEVLGSFPQRNLDIVFIDALKTQYTDYLGYRRDPRVQQSVPQPPRARRDHRADRRRDRHRCARRLTASARRCAAFRPVSRS
jgi:hypothetical protein